ncbi:single-stranded DNA-binding protein [Bifidobacterium choerinum]|uniref:Single-stranded DNA-binding protein n=1 Tax=Bifidobacterium choerinum TaxID=35760 RepID=A0A087AFA6_9BIFI|nr:single-stranded DNA-binding protein [Bifidobacterium choerinum]KFI57456.1 single-stranded DNA-binding protein [Bifidobacterium choerinum]
MAGETIITIAGNLTRDPELRTVGNGSTVVNFTIASSTRTFNRNTNQWEDGDTLFMNCSAWDSAHTSLASNIANSLSKGMSVIAQGRLMQRSYQAQDGSQRTVVELRVEDIGPSLRRATAQVQRQSSSSGFVGNQQSGFNHNGGFQQQPAQQNGWGAPPQQQAAPQQAQQPANDPWANEPQGFKSGFGAPDWTPNNNDDDF